MYTWIFKILFFLNIMRLRISIYAIYLSVNDLSTYDVKDVKKNLDIMLTSILESNQINTNSTANVFNGLRKSKPDTRLIKEIQLFGNRNKYH